MEAETQQTASTADRKACIACGEMIPATATVCSHCLHSQVPEKAAPMKSVMGWVGSASALLGLGATLFGALHWVASHKEQHSEMSSQMAVAETQAKQGEYEPAVQSYAVILKTDPLYRKALDEQLHAAELWVENFSVVGEEGKTDTQLASPGLDQIMGILNAGLAREKGTGAADIEAHLGWAHWLNSRIAEREYGPAAEQDLKTALQLDASNVYANAMLGNWMLQNGGDLKEAVGHFNTAVATGKARPLVREMQINALREDETPGARAELVKALNDMRKGGEPLDEGTRSRALEYCCDPTAVERAELSEALSAVSPDDAWQTYLWLDDAPQRPDPEGRQMHREYVSADLLEISGKRAEALAKYQTLQAELKVRNRPGDFWDSVNAAVKRLGGS